VGLWVRLFLTWLHSGRCNSRAVLTRRGVSPGLVLKRNVDCGLRCHCSTVRLWRSRIGCSTSTTQAARSGKQEARSKASIIDPEHYSSLVARCSTLPLLPYVISGPTPISPVVQLTGASLPWTHPSLLGASALSFVYHHVESQRLSSLVLF
jgi:hypothetical protein